MSRILILSKLGMWSTFDAKKVNILKVLASTEPAILKLDPVVNHPLRTDITKVLLNSKVNSSQHSVDSTVLKSLSNDSSITIMKADKGTLCGYIG